MATTTDKPKDPLITFWNCPLSEVVRVENHEIAAAEAERHYIFCLLAFSMVADAFNGNKKGPVGKYPFRAEQEISAGRYMGDVMWDRYLGHNIACLGVDARGEIVDFDFNHNETFNSSVEHAETRLVRRIFNLNQAFDHWETIEPSEIKDIPYATTLSGVTVYTTLESCAQCSGVMTLGNVKAVVYMQADPGQYRIGNILYNLSNPASISRPSENPPQNGAKPVSKYGAPEPIPADLVGFQYKREIEAAYEAYRLDVEKTPFFESSDGKTKDSSNSITSFLCTDVARGIFRKAAAELDAFELKFPNYPEMEQRKLPPALSNAEVLRQAKLFRTYAARTARRGTPHR